VVPKGFVRVLGKLAELKDAGIDIYFFVGILPEFIIAPFLLFIKGKIS